MDGMASIQESPPDITRLPVDDLRARIDLTQSTITNTQQEEL